MFKVNDYIVYSSMGVCQVTDIRKEVVNGNEIEYYVLQPYYNNNNILIKIPVNNQKVLMRQVISKDYLFSLIEAMPEKETVWINDHRQRSEYFKAAFKTGECEELVKLIKTIYLKKQEKSALGKKLMKTDEDIFKAAEKSLYEEFAFVLKISPDEVVSYILEHIS